MSKKRQKSKSQSGTAAVGAGLPVTATKQPAEMAAPVLAPQPSQSQVTKSTDTQGKGMSKIDKIQTVGILFSIVLSGISLYVARQSNEYSRQQAETAREAIARSSGRITAKLEILGISPQLDDLPPEVVTKFLPDLDLKSVCFRNIDDLFLVNPRINVKNTGTEPIDAIRIETRFSMGMVDAISLPKDRQEARSPFVLKQNEKEDYPLSQKLKPGDVAMIPLTRGLLAQMLQAQNPTISERKHYARFDVRCYGRIVGAGSFDSSDTNSGMLISFMWIPTGFPEDKCRKTLELIQPDVEIIKAK